MGSHGERLAAARAAIARWCAPRGKAGWCAGFGGALALLSAWLWWWPSGSAAASWAGGVLPLLAVVGLALLVRGLLRQRQAWQQAATAARREREVAERAQGERSRLLSAMVRDLRQPLYAMSLTAQSLQRHRPLRNAAPFLDQLRSALASADELLDSIDTLALLEAGALRPRPTVFSVQAMLERLDQRHGPQARAHGLHWTVTPSLEHAHTDAVLLERMLGQLLASAVHDTLRGGVLLSCRRRGGMLLIQVWDTGRGRASADPAEPAGTPSREPARTRADTGTAMGLSLVERTADLLGIGMDVRSRPGSGTCVSLRVPAAAPLSYRGAANTDASVLSSSSG
jgi:signal transduction histidine kinase